MEERPAIRAAREAHIWLQTFVVAIVALVLLFVFVGRPVMVDGDSMLPTLRDRELMLVRRAGYDPQPGDVVVLRKAFRDVTGPIVKRVIAVEGQRVEIDYAAGTVSVDGVVLDEDYMLEPMVQQSWQGITTLTVPEGCVFVMGGQPQHLRRQPGRGAGCGGGELSPGEGGAGPLPLCKFWSHFLKRREPFPGPVV